MACTIGAHDALLRLLRALSVFVAASVLGPLVPAIILMLIFLPLKFGLTLASIPDAATLVSLIIGASYLAGAPLAASSGVVVGALAFLFGTLTPALVVGGTVLGTTIALWADAGFARLETGFVLFLGVVGVISAVFIFSLTRELGMFPRRGVFVCGAFRRRSPGSSDNGDR